MKKVFISLFMLASFASIYANGILIGELYYNLDASTLTAEVTHYHDLSQNYVGKTTINIPSSVEYENVTYTVNRISDWAFSYCHSLTSVTMPNSITSVGNYVFDNSDNMTSPVFNAHVFAFLPRTYSGTYSIQDGITSIAGSAFKRCYNLTNVSIPNGVVEIADNTFEDCSGLTEINIPNTVKKIGYSAFIRCNHLTSIEIPGSVDSIQNGAFAECTALTSLKLNNGLSYLAPGVFLYCTGLTSVALPESMTVVGPYVFQDCTSLASIILPSSILWLYYGAFSNCTRLKSVYCYAVAPPFGDNQMFDGVDCSHVTLYVPSESVEDYQNSYVWNRFNPIKAIGEPDTINCNVTYLEKEGSFFSQQAVELIVPVAPIIDGFTFLYWKTLEGNVADGITIQAIYSYNGGQTSLPAEIVNPSNPSQKLIRNGNVYILTGDKTYTITGAEVK